ncbi:HigA family addiction module antitoxin [Thiofaba sp. EF100]|jgi:addiction module HigA family antidote|uniref:HigA family addiction module antitoxin n=1 Tax=Thiofaba sp. EF100 TaxID=3121274 RepID=UPI003221FAAF
MNATRMHNPPHPGEVLKAWLPEGMTVTEAAQALHVDRVTLSKLLNGRAGVSAGMALRLAQWLGTSPDLWLGLQVQYDLWRASQHRLPPIEPLRKPEPAAA